MALSVRGHHTDALPDALRQVALLALPALRIHLHERLERVRQTRQVRLRGRNRRQGQRRIPRRSKGRQAQAQRHRPGRGVGGGGGVGVGGRERQRGGHAEDRWQTKMRRERRRPSAGASYRCSLALPDEAFSQHTDLLPGLDQGDDLLSHMSKRTRGRGWFDQDGVTNESNKVRYVPEFVFQITGDGHLFDAVDALACRFFFQRDC